MKKTLFFVVAFAMFAGVVFAEPVDFHEPKGVTITATAIGNTYAASTDWEKLLGSDVSSDATMYYTTWRITELERAYDIYYAYKDDPQVGEYTKILASDPPLERRLSHETASGGIYVKVTYSASYAGDISTPIYVIFESYK